MSDETGPGPVGPPPPLSAVVGGGNARRSKRDKASMFDCEHSSVGCYWCRVKANALPLPSWEAAGDSYRRYLEFLETGSWPRSPGEVYTLGDIINKRPLYRQDVVDENDNGWDKSIPDVLVLDFGKKRVRRKGEKDE